MPGAGNLPLAGVQAIVEGLSSFEGDMKSMARSINGLQPGTTLLQRAFSSAWDTVKGFGREILNVAEYALGHLLSDAIQWAVAKLGDLIKATIEAGSEFQTLELRLNRLNFNALVDAGEDYNKATEKSVKLTKEQLIWLQKLAATTPYDNTDISNVYTLARSYGFADDRAQSLTESITNFASGMGLGSQEIERIIINFGQLVQQGKINQRELNDLARGSFVPVNDVLRITQERLGLTNKEFEKMKQKGKLTGDAVEAFILSFEELVKRRFVGAAEQMAKTFKAASDNALDVVKSIGGLHVVKPVLDAVGERIAAFVSAFTDDPVRWDRMVEAAKRVGNELARIVGGVSDLLPSSEAIADSAVRAVEGIADWLAQNGPGIKLFFRELGQIVGGVADKIRRALSAGQGGEGAQDTGTFFRGIMPGQENPMQAPTNPFGQGILDAIQKIADFINNTLIPAFIKIQVWFEVNKPLIDEFWSTVWEIISEVISDIMGGPKKDGKKDVLALITDFMQFVIDNKDSIVKFVEVLWSLFIIWQLLATALNILVPIIVTLISVFTLANSIIAALGPIIATLLPWILGIVGVVILVRGAIIEFGDEFKVLGEKIKSLNWPDIGRKVVLGIVSGLYGSVGFVAEAARRVALSAYNAALSALGIRSPSKLFMGIGEMTMEGFALGIEKAAGLAVGAMQNAVGAVAMPAMASMAAAQGGSTAITNNREANLIIHSSAPRESIMQDFAMMESLMGA